MKKLIILFYGCSLFFGCQQVDKFIGQQKKNDESESGLVQTYYDNGKLKSEVRFDDQKRKHGVSKSFYPSGKLKTEITYDRGLKTYALQYHDNGNKYMEFFYKNGKKDSLRTKYWESGEVQSKLWYSEDRPGIGLEEFNKKGKKLTKYPKLIVNQIDRLEQDGEYIIEVYFEGIKKRATYYEGRLEDGQFFNKYQPEMKMVNGRARLVLRPMPGTFIMDKVYFIGKYRTFYNNPYIVEKSINLAVDY